MKRADTEARRRAAREIDAAFASLARQRNALETLLDAGDMAAAGSEAGRFGEKAGQLRRLLATHLPETGPPPDAFGRTVCCDDDEHALRMEMPERLHAAMSWLGKRRRETLEALRGHSRAFYFLRGCLVLALAAMLAFGGRAVWKAAVHRQELAALSDFDVDLLAAPDAVPRDFKTAGLLSVERGEGHVWRWGVGPRTVLAFVLYEPRVMRLALRLSNPVPGQTLTVTTNGQETSWQLPQAKPWMRDQDDFSTTFTGIVGLNTVLVDYRLYNQHGMAFAPDNQTPFAAAYTEIRLTTRRP